jgi:hypothetical protein
MDKAESKPKSAAPSEEADAVAVAELVHDVQNALDHLRRAQGYGRITVEVTVRGGVISMWEIAPHLSRKPAYPRQRS